MTIIKIFTCMSNHFHFFLKVYTSQQCSGFFFKMKQKSDQARIPYALLLMDNFIHNEWQGSIIQKRAITRTKTSDQNFLIICTSILCINIKILNHKDLKFQEILWNRNFLTKCSYTLCSNFLKFHKIMCGDSRKVRLHNVNHYIQNSRNFQKKTRNLVSCTSTLCVLNTYKLLRNYLKWFKRSCTY